VSTLREILASGRSRATLRERTLEERVALDLAFSCDYARRVRWRDAARGATVMARHDREAAITLTRIGLDDAARIAREDAAERSRTAATIVAVLQLFPLPPDFWLD
jgi:hypothetical protein